MAATDRATYEAIFGVDLKNTCSAFIVFPLVINDRHRLAKFVQAKSSIWEKGEPFAFFS
jgi:hypothetical protein